MVEKDSLHRYESIASRETRPRYMLTRGVRCELPLDADIGTLWEIHDLRLAELQTADPDYEGSDNLLALKAAIADRMLSECMLCERRCGVDRKAGVRGKCGVLEAMIASDFIHMGEEPEVIPSYTIFFSGCTFRCVYCQNWDISTAPGSGRRVEPEDLASMIEAHDPGASPLSDRARMIHDLVPFARPAWAKNVNWVGGDPTSNLTFILETLLSCRSRLPQVWNSNMYLTKESMRLLDGVVDLYLTDFKYGNDRCAERLSGVKRYFEVISRNHRIAAEQCDLIIRHLVLPSHFDCCTKPILEWIAENTPEAVVNVMAQYRPEHRARQFEEIARPLSGREYAEAIRIAMDLGLNLTR